MKVVYTCDRVADDGTTVSMKVVATSNPDNTGSYFVQITDADGSVVKEEFPVTWNGGGINSPEGIKLHNYFYEMDSCAGQIVAMLNDNLVESVPRSSDMDELLHSLGVDAEEFV